MSIIVTFTQHTNFQLLIHILKDFKLVLLLICELICMCQHGKDFDAIQSVLTQKLKKRSDNDTTLPTVKTKDQIRHFYYRTWHKISSYVSSSTVEGRSSFLQPFFERCDYICLFIFLRGCLFSDVDTIY